MVSNPRYNGKPLLRLLELYVLRAIDELPLAERQILERLGPKLQALYGGDGEWYQAVAAAVRAPADMQVSIRNMWARSLDIARANGTVLSPQNFAEIFVDENFAPKFADAK
jgi:hypothetical protein